MSNFTSISPHYRKTALLQKSAAERLFGMLDIGREDDVLDLGCGPGHLANKIRAMTKGVVAGIDPSPGMIAEALHNYPAGIEFSVAGAETLSASEQYDAIFCNSVFQWFRDPARAVSNCHNALRPGGRMAIQAPARQNYCPNFLRAVATLGDDTRTRDTFGHFISPWLFLDTAEEYAALFKNAGFKVLSSDIEQVPQLCGPEKVMEMFESGAAAGYLNPDCYDVTLPSAYIGAARELIAQDFHAQTKTNGQVELTFNRIYLLAHKI
ncbi:MAG: methyltransferase domain-containing protein [Nitrosomonadales bacterium]|nr:methyltransferase domain-containing protein [Nitrosomonadales bacterium]